MNSLKSLRNTTWILVCAIIVTATISFSIIYKLTSKAWSQAGQDISPQIVAKSIKTAMSVGILQLVLFVFLIVLLIMIEIKKNQIKKIRL